MSTKRKHGRKRNPIVRLPSHTRFTLPELRLLKEALAIFEKGLLDTTKPRPNRQFAVDTLDQLKLKLTNMLELEEWEKETPLDYNEVHLLYAAIHMCLVDLQLAQRTDLIPQCLALCKHFTSLIESIRREIPPRR